MAASPRTILDEHGIGPHHRRCGEFDQETRGIREISGSTRGTVQCTGEADYCKCCVAFLLLVNVNVALILHNYFCNK